MNDTSSPSPTPHPTSAANAPVRPAPSRHPLAPLFNADTVRLRCQSVLQSVQGNLSGHFKLDQPAFERLSGAVLQHLAATPAAPLDGRDAPFWQHLQAGGVDRLAELDRLISGQPAHEQARALADLALLGVLFSADPGPRWRYCEQQAVPTAAFAQADPDDLLAMLDRAGKTALPAAATDAGSPALAAAVGGDANTEAWGGSTGLAIAAFRAFVAGAFSADRAQPCRVDASTLRHIDVAAVRGLLQGTPLNPVQGLEGRAAVLSRLGQLLQALPGAGGAQARPWQLVPMLVAPGDAGSQVQAQALLQSLLRSMAAVWPTPPVQGLPAGDVWPHRWAGGAVGADAASAGAATDLGTTGWVPLHAMGQALVATLALPLQRAGHHLAGLQGLTATADHAACGLMLTAGVLVARQPRMLARQLTMGDEAVVECRALTVALFEALTTQVRSARQATQGAQGAQVAQPTVAHLTVAQVVRAVQAVLAGRSPQALTVEGDGALY